MKGNTGIDWIFRNNRWDKCFIPKEGYYLLSDETTEFLKYVKVERIIPLYMPREKYPIGFYTILVDTQKSLRDEGYIQRASVSSNGYKRLFPRFFGWNYITQKPTSEWMKNVQAYLKSREEPFVSAPVLQMYWYLSQPLLVARDENGKVFSVFFLKGYTESHGESETLSLKWMGKTTRVIHGGNVLLAGSQRPSFFL